MRKIRGFKKYLLKAVKFLITLLSNFGRNQIIINNLLIWLNIQQGKNAPINNEIEVKFVSRFLDLNKNLLIIDVGGHQGSYTDELLKIYPNANIILFEPSINKCKMLINKYKDNKNINIENFALSNISGKGKLYSNADEDSLATLFKREEKNRDRFFSLEEDIEIIQLSKYWSEKLNFQKIDLIKLDIEGSEFNVIKDLENYLEKINLIQFEFGEANIGSRIFFKDFWNIFNQNNFSIFRYTHKGHLIEIHEYTEYDEFFRYTNYLAVNKNIIN
tara:strand:+ start:1165 stop:1986 length:822 start_codon:yes stop_codon:yes gene_type:complete